MSIVTKDVQYARHLVGGGTATARYEKNKAHRRHRRNQRDLLNKISQGSRDADDDLDFISKPCTGWEIS